jgi:hypothetical protein
MKITLALISPRRGSPSGPSAELLRMYLERATRYIPCELRVFPSEAHLLEFLAGSSARTRPALLLADGRGQQISSPELAAAIGALQDAGTQQRWPAPTAPSPSAASRCPMNSPPPSPLSRSTAPSPSGPATPTTADTDTSATPAAHFNLAPAWKLSSKAGTRSLPGKADRASHRPLSLC